MVFNVGRKKQAQENPHFTFPVLYPEQTVSSDGAYDLASPSLATFNSRLTDEHIQWASFYWGGKQIFLFDIIITSYLY